MIGSQINIFRARPGAKAMMAMVFTAFLFVLSSTTYASSNIDEKFLDARNNAHLAGKRLDLKPWVAHYAEMSKDSKTALLHLSIDHNDAVSVQKILDLDPTTWNGVKLGKILDNEVRTSLNPADLALPVIRKLYEKSKPSFTGDSLLKLFDNAFGNKNFIFIIEILLGDNLVSESMILYRQSPYCHSSYAWLLHHQKAQRWVKSASFWRKALKVSGSLKYFLASIPAFRLPKYHLAIIS